MSSPFLAILQTKDNSNNWSFVVREIFYTFIQSNISTRPMY